MILTSEKVSSSNSEVGGDGFGIPGRGEILVSPVTKPLVRNLKGKKKNLKPSDFINDPS